VAVPPVEVKPLVAAGPSADAAAGGDVAAAEKTPPVAEKSEKTEKKEAGKDEEPDEEALLRDAVPDAESAVIGEDEAEAPPPPKAAKGAAKGRPPVAKATPTKSEAAKPETAKPEAKPVTAVLHLTSAPGRAIVRTKFRVLGRTPINLHFKTGNLYEIIFIKSGYQTATRRVEVKGTKDRKVAVTLKKKKAAPKKSFFHPHR
jgi:hypothetical protein